MLCILHLWAIFSEVFQFGLELGSVRVFFCVGMPGLDDFIDTASFFFQSMPVRFKLLFRLRTIFTVRQVKGFLQVL